MKVLIIDNTHPLLNEKLTAMGFTCMPFTGSSIEDMMSIINEYTGIIIRSKFAIDKTIIDKATKLKFIGRVGSGMESIDVAYAEKKGIACLNSPEGNRDAVGEHTLGLLLCLLNKIAFADSQIRKGIRQREANRGVEIKGKTVAIVGYGNMGSAFAKCISGFGASVIAYDKYKKNYSDVYVRETSLENIFENADIISLHVPLNKETHYMVDESFIDKVKKNFYLINTSRGQVVRTDALTDALAKGKILGAALDVIEYESISFEKLENAKLPIAYNYLIKSEKVVMTPHVAGWTNESKIKLVEVLAEKIKSLIL